MQVGSKASYDHGWASWVWGMAFQAMIARLSPVPSFQGPQLLVHLLLGQPLGELLALHAGLHTRSGFHLELGAMNTCEPLISELKPKDTTHISMRTPLRRLEHVHPRHTCM